MITNSNRVYFDKMLGRAFQEELIDWTPPNVPLFGLGLSWFPASPSN